jgi:ribA/ribD-fused uncharacterized protein
MILSPILEFRGPHRYLSNFYLCKFTWQGIEWPHSEAAYQAAKFPRHQWNKFLVLSPNAAKYAGKAPGMRADWEDVKIEIMYSIVREKFCQNIELLEKLLATGNAHLEEGNTWKDVFWGVCPPGSKKGRNELGKILMRIRQEFTETQDDGIIYYDSCS